jgi:hypothetical protein
LKIKLATSVSTPSLVIAGGGEVSVALLIDCTNEGFGLLRRSWIDVAQETVERKLLPVCEVRRIVRRCEDEKSML